MGRKVKRFKNSKLPVIKFASDEIDVHDIPKPSKLSVPDWYKNNSLNFEGTNNLIPEGNISHTFKRCVPFLDCLTSGYIAELWSDVIVRKDPTGKSTFEWRTGRAVLEERPLQTSLELPVPAGHSIQRLAWKVPYYLQTSKGYSALITHPLNRFDLPFTTLSGIVDTDEVMYAGNIPFFIRADFEGIILKGTPIYQIIPFRREDWTSQQDVEIINQGHINHRRSFSVMNGWYKRNVWSRKNYL